MAAVTLAAGRMSFAAGCADVRQLTVSVPCALNDENAGAERTVLFVTVHVSGSMTSRGVS